MDRAGCPAAGASTVTVPSAQLQLDEGPTGTIFMMPVLASSL